ncbi:MAG TPA: hypothetical protein V6C84_16125 [Coleofasciculaceae cyanobacterium]|jgi:hypothetical protein
MNSRKSAAALTSYIDGKGFPSHPQTGPFKVDRTLAAEMVNYVVGTLPSPSLNKMQHRCYKLIDILGKIAIAFNAIEDIEQLEQDAAAQALIDRLKHSYNPATNSEAELFNVLGNHLGNTVDGRSVKTAIAFRFATALRVATCFVDWASEPQSSESAGE